MNFYESKKFGKIDNMVDNSESEPMRESLKYLADRKLPKECAFIKTCHIVRFNKKSCINDEELCYWLK